MKIKEIMAMRGITAHRLAEKSGVSVRTIEQYMSGRADIKNARAHIVVSLAEALEVTPKQLFD